MNKKELIDAVASQTGETTAATQRVLDAFADTVVGELVAGNDVKFAGLGTFTTGQRAARVGRNPQTGESLQIAAKRTVKFKPGKNFKDAVNG